MGYIYGAFTANGATVGTALEQFDRTNNYVLFSTGRIH
jgi:hypothetical protein